MDNFKINTKYIVKYFQPVLDQGWRIEERQGSNAIVNYNNGIVNYEQIDGFNTIEDCNKFIKEKSAITNGIKGCKDKKYIKFTVIENTENL